MEERGGRLGIRRIVRLMQWRTIVVFLVAFVTVLRAASATSWAIMGTSLTATGVVAAFLLSGIAAGAWHRYQTAHRPSHGLRRSDHEHPRPGRLVAAR